MDKDQGAFNLFRNTKGWDEGAESYNTARREYDALPSADKEHWRGRYLAEVDKPLGPIPNRARLEANLREIVAFVHQRNVRWWVDPKTGLRLDRNVGEMLMLTVSEVAEGMEGHRKNLQDGHLPQHKSLTVELGDAVIRVFDIADGLDLDFATAFFDKIEYNGVRVDHTHAARRKDDGKKY